MAVYATTKQCQLLFCKSVWLIQIVLESISNELHSLTADVMWKQMKKYNLKISIQIQLKLRIFTFVHGFKQTSMFFL